MRSAPLGNGAKVGSNPKRNDVSLAQPSIAELKAAFNFRNLVLTTHDIDRSGFINCPVHADKNPSCKINDDYAYCFSCHWQADHIGWLETIYNLDTSEAIKKLSDLIGQPQVANQRKRVTRTEPERKLPQFSEVVFTQHYEAVERLNAIPKALEARGFTLDDLKVLGIASDKTNLHAAFLLSDGLSFTGRKVRRGDSKPRYKVTHETLNKGMAWVSPCYELYDELILIEGELNAMSVYLSDIPYGVIGCSSSSNIDRLPLKNKTVYLITDADKAGQNYKHLWSQSAYKAEAQKVVHIFSDVLFGEGLDANDFMIKQGLEALRKAIL